MKINTFDIDGVVFMDDHDGVYPGKNDILITGRSIEEEKETRKMLEDKGIFNSVCFNPLPFDQKTRQTSGMHKANVISALIFNGYRIGYHIDDDPIQIEEIKKVHPGLNTILLQHNLVEKENVRHL